MGNQYSNYSQTQSIAAANDINAPYSFAGWYERNTGIPSGEENILYQKYLRDWYANSTAAIPTKDSIKESYINLIKQLTVTFKNDDDKIWATDINFDDPIEVAQAIPFYASKLKDIAIYFIQKRESIRKAKLKYNLAGTSEGVENLFREYFLRAFTKRKYPWGEYITNITDTSLLSALPELADVNTNLQIEIEELYDDSSYLDRDPTVPASSYFTFTSDVTSYLDTLNIAPDQYEWLYNTGVASLCADNPLLWSLDAVMAQYKNGVPISALELSDSTLLNEYNKFELTRKYMGTTQNILSGGYWIPRVESIVIPMKKGNNWFNWGSSDARYKAYDYNYLPLPLSAACLYSTGATAATTPLSSDIIIVNRGTDTKAAWLNSSRTQIATPVMSARMVPGDNIFSFPFPGYGLAGDDMPWSGKSMDNLDPTFLYLSDEYKRTVMESYWADVLLGSSNKFESIRINDTNLAECRAIPSRTIQSADQIHLRTNYSGNNIVYNGIQRDAWLYHMTTTDIPVSAGENRIYWPFERYTSVISTVAKKDQCTPMPLSSFNMQELVGPVAGASPDASDIIYKSDTPTSKKFTEAAWLSGKPFNISSYITDAQLVSSCLQPAIAMQIAGGNRGVFTWTNATTAADAIFKYVPHQSTCDYLAAPQFSLYKNRPVMDEEYDYNQWDRCNCRAIVYNPLGHPGATFDEYDAMSDYIVSITNSVSSFSLKDWRGTDGLGYRNSSDFGWYKTNSNQTIEPDVGWGYGAWVNYSGEPFKLKTGVTYAYNRNSLHRDDANINTPYLVTKIKNNDSLASWVKMVFNPTEQIWEDAGVASDMIVKPGDILHYNHQTSFSITLTAPRYEFTTVEVNQPPDLNNFSLKANLSQLDMPKQVISTPIVTVDPASITAGDLSSTSFTTAGIITGEYYTMPSGALTVSGSIENMLPVTMTTILSTITSTYTDYFVYQNDAINFVMNLPLSGWNYDYSVYDGISPGAKPFWCIASNLDDDYTKNKKLESWSGLPTPVDKYNFVSQPMFSPDVINNQDYIRYSHRGSGLIWKQPTTEHTTVTANRWCGIDISQTTSSNLSAYLKNNTEDILASSNFDESDIVFDTDKSNPISVNYYARNPFVWSQCVTATTDLNDPSKGTWMEITSGLLVEPLAPYSNLTNRHFPTYATMPFVGELYSEKEYGGFMLPKLLGVSTAFAIQLSNKLDTTNITSDLSARGTSAIFRDIGVYASDRGLTHAEQVSPVIVIEGDKSAIKTSVTAGIRGGVQASARPFQKLSPYQTKFENTGRNDNGFYLQGEEKYDPWYGDLDNTWYDNTTWPSNFRKQYPIKQWYSLEVQDRPQVYQWKTDVFGNHFALLKAASYDKTIFEKKNEVYGTIWIRDQKGKYATLADAFGSSVSSLLGSANVLDIDLWFNTLFILTSDHIHMLKYDFDYDTNTFVYDAGNIISIDYTNQVYGGLWFDEAIKTVTFNLIDNDGSAICVYQVDMNTMQLNIRIDDELDLSGVVIDTIESPALTYSQVHKKFVQCFLGYTTIDPFRKYLIVVQIKNNISELLITAVKIITPSP